MRQVRSPTKRSLDPERESVTRRLTLLPYDSPRENSAIDVYVTVGTFPDGTPGEIFLKVSRQGTALSGFANALALAISIGLHYGVPLSEYVEKLRHVRFEPDGMILNPWSKTERQASSLVDMVMGWIGHKFCTGEADGG